MTWDTFKGAFRGKYVGASYIEARCHEFMNLEQGDRTIIEYKTKFLRLSHYASALIVIEYDKCVHFEDRLRYELKVLIASQRERVFVMLVDKVKITKEVKRVEQEKKE